MNFNYFILREAKSHYLKGYRYLQKLQEYVRTKHNRLITYQFLNYLKYNVHYCTKEFIYITSHSFFLQALPLQFF